MTQIQWVFVLADTRVWVDETSKKSKFLCSHGNSHFNGFQLLFETTKLGAVTILSQAPLDWQLHDAEPRMGGTPWMVPLSYLSSIQRHRRFPFCLRADTWTGIRKTGIFLRTILQRVIHLRQISV